MTIPRFVDVHCHLLPAIDDGPADWPQSLALAAMLHAEGVCTVIATPHQLGRYEANTPARIRQLVAEAQRRFHDAGIPLTVLPGADVRVTDDLVDRLRRGEVQTLGSANRYLLLELPHDLALPLGRLIYQLESEGVGSILSHPERNLALQAGPDRLRPWVAQGCLVQVTAGSIVGRFGPEARHVCRRLIQDDLVHLVASDAHDVSARPPLLQEAFAVVQRWAGSSVAENLFCVNPAAVAAGDDVHVPFPIARRAGWGRWVRRLIGSGAT